MFEITWTDDVRYFITSCFVNENGMGILANNKNEFLAELSPEYFRNVLVSERNTNVFTFFGNLMQQKF